MPLTTGQTLSCYEILGPLGAGGMGEVYRARDTRLSREVAIKVLPEELAGDKERMQRFEREAKTLASLNHPNIAAIYAVDNVDGVFFLALEYVRGEDLAAQIARGPMPIDEAIDVGRQIADGLESAHEAGIVHRDLKPANIRVTPDRVVKILDFGLAKPLRSEVDPEGPTRSEPDSYLITEEGKVLGTPTYMSPEQARGKPVDRRTDIWAFGCVLYECLTGRRAFGGETFSDVLAAIVGSDPGFAAVPARTPVRVLELLKRCLAKDPFRRLRDIGEARVALEDPGPSSPVAQREIAAPRPSGRWTAAAVIAVALAMVVWGLKVPEKNSGDLPMRLSVTFAPDHELLTVEHTNLAISDDGRRVAWVGGAEERVHVRELDSYDVRALEGTESACSPFFSPDGEWVGYFVGDRLMKVSLGGGTPLLVVDEREYRALIKSYDTRPRGASWGSDGWIVLVPTTVGGIFRVREEGGPIEAVTEVRGDERTHRWPRLVDGGRAVVYTVDGNSSPEFYDDARVDFYSFETGERRVLVEGASQAHIAAGLLAFARGGSIYVQPIDAATGITRGAARVVVSQVETDVSSGAVQFVLAENGTLIYSPGKQYPRLLRLAWQDPAEGSTVLDFPAAAYSEPRLSPDHRRLAFVRSSRGSTDVLIHDFARATTTNLTNTGYAMAPIWSSDGKSIAYQSRWPAGIFIRSVGSVGEPRHVLETPSPAWPICFTPDGELICGWYREGTLHDIVRLDPATGEVTDIIATAAADKYAAVSPDGRLLAYASDESGLFEIYLTTFAAPTVRWQVSNSGGEDPVWSRDGRTLYYLRVEDEELWAVDVRPEGAEPDLGAPRRLMESFFVNQDFRFNYDIGPDGRFITIVRGEVPQVPLREVRVLPGWAAEQRRASSEAR